MTSSILPAMLILTLQVRADQPSYFLLMIKMMANTSLGAISSGDEVVGLSRGMLYAGTPSLLGSLWSIDDKATSILMSSFYEGLQKGKKPTSALREAQLGLLKYKDKSSIKRSVKIVDKEKQVSFTSSYSHPFFWAAFNIIGDWQ